MLNVEKVSQNNFQHASLGLKVVKLNIQVYRCV